ncbi:unnamed protein product [Euphydryas editha]|uniref:Tudor domain-containing protein n=1 Tax=Euphydryas editha TaxID=104508 RepID=A0AAU9UXN3_EUPED|nr:unnamed protein product [Euphydryas editha]
MEVLESILQELSITKFDVQTVHWVNVTHIIDPHDFYVRPTRYYLFIKKLETSQPLIKPSSLNEYDVVIYNIDRSSNNIRYGRGRICNKHIIGNTFKYDILAIDYGYFHTMVPEECIWECNEDLLRIPPLALHCQLANCTVSGGNIWNKTSIDAFKSYVGNEKAKMIILDKIFDKLIIELRNSNPDDIATLMALTGYSTMGYVHNAITRISTIVQKKMFFTYKSININDSLHVRVQSGTSLEAFYVADINDYHIFLKERENITYYAKQESKLPEEQFKVNTLVCVKNDLNKYDRGIITKIITSDSRAIVKLVDWGKEEQVHILNMRPMPEQCLKIPVLAIYCSAHEKQVLDFALHKLLCPGLEFFIQIEQLGIKFESPNIVNIIPFNSSKK